MSKQRIEPQPPPRFCEPPAFVLVSKCGTGIYAFAIDVGFKRTPVWPAGDEPGLTAPAGCEPVLLDGVWYWEPKTSKVAS